jgi:6-pyruvoyltetrahydropterin/6-carboxytetrahydropterin synthase
MRISKSFTFEAAHRLQQHNGKCSHLHGHSYKVEVFVDGPNWQPLLSAPGESSSGMLLDFKELSDWWREVEPIFDHHTILEGTDPLVKVLTLAGELNYVLLVPWPPTAENLAMYLRDSFAEWLYRNADRGGLSVHVRVWETEKSWAEV